MDVEVRLLSVSVEQPQSTVRAAAETAHAAIVLAEEIRLRSISALVE